MEANKMKNKDAKKNTQKKQLLIAAVTDLSKSFVDENGSFYCGSTKEHKENARDIVKAVLDRGGIVVYNTDLHPYTSLEFSINGGLYPVHNLPKKFWNEAYDKNPGLENKSLSPELTDVVNDVLKGVKTGIFAPRHVYFQEPDKTKVSYAPQDIVDTYGKDIISGEDFIKGDFKYIIAPKKFFDATRLVTDTDTGKDVNVYGVPDIEKNIWSLIKQKYPDSEYDITIVNPSVVEGICTLMTATGQRQTFPSAKIITPSDGVTPLVGLAFETSMQSRDACKKIAADMGIEYKTTKEIIADLRYGQNLVDEDTENICGLDHVHDEHIYKW